MKFYLLFFLFFLSSLSLPILSFSQEKSTHPSVSSSETSSLHELEKNQESVEMSEPWQEPAEKESDSFQAKFFNMLFILGLLIGFMMLASWAIKRMMKTKMTNLNTENTIKVLETRYLSPRATLYLIEIENHTFLIAESPTSVTSLGAVPKMLAP